MKRRHHRTAAAAGVLAAALALTATGVAIAIENCQEALEPGQSTALGGGECLDTTPGQKIQVDEGGSGQYGPCQDAPAERYVAPQEGAYVRDCT